jgi:hypothetical protein
MYRWGKPGNRFEGLLSVDGDLHLILGGAAL